MKIILVNKFYYSRGGDCNYTLALERLLKKNGHEVAVFSMNFPENLITNYKYYFPSEVNFSSKNPIKILKAIMRTFGINEVSNKFNRLIDDFNPNIVHLNNIHSYLSPIIASIARKRNIRVIWTLHDYKLLCPRYDCLKNNIPCEKCFKNKKFVILNRCMKNSFMGSLVAFAEALYWNRAKLEKNTDHFICPSEFMKFKMLKGGFNPKKLSSVYNFIEEEKTINDHFEKENYVSYLGRLSSEKGLYTLLKAIYDLKIHIKIIGSGPIEEELKNVFKNENIEFLGYQSWSSIKEIIQLAKFVILPSEWYENNPLSVIESLCLGTPVLCSRIGGMPELINIGINGNLFESGDVDDLKKKIVETYQMQFDYRKIAEISKLKFSSVKYYKQIMEIYK